MSLLKDKIELNIQEAELGAQKALSRFPRPLRWLFILCLLALIPGYFVAKNVSYKIWLNRYSQGQITAKASFTNPKDPVVSNIYLTSQGPNAYAAAVKLSNQNLDLSLENEGFKFTFFNDQKQEVYSYSGSLFLLPNQAKYIIAPPFNSSAKVAFANFDLTNPLKWQKRLNTPTVSLKTSLPNSYFQASPTAFVVEGDYINNSPYKLAAVQLTFVLFDVSGNIIGVSSRQDSTLSAFERRAYKQLWPNVAANNLGRVEVDADTNTLDPNNLSTNSSPAGPASDLSR